MELKNALDEYINRNPTGNTSFYINERYTIEYKGTTVTIPNPSVVFKNTFPVNPSVTTASISPEKQSLPSTLPTKLIPNSSDCSFKILYVIFLLNVNHFLFALLLFAYQLTKFTCFYKINLKRFQFFY